MKRIVDKTKVPVKLVVSLETFFYSSGKKKWDDMDVAYIKKTMLEHIKDMSYVDYPGENCTGYVKVKQVKTK